MPLSDVVRPSASFEASKAKGLKIAGGCARCTSCAYVMAPIFACAKWGQTVITAQGLTGLRGSSLRFSPAQATRGQGATKKCSLNTDVFTLQVTLA